jgi:hypothetical protein
VNVLWATDATLFFRNIVEAGGCGFPKGRVSHAREGRTSSPRSHLAFFGVLVARYGLMWEFISAIVERRAAVLGSLDIVKTYLFIDSVLESHSRMSWIEIPAPQA